MGATTFYRVAYANSSDEAFDAAYEEALSERGHQEGYSGDLNSKPGFQLAKAPPDVDLTTWLDALRNGELPEALKIHSREFEFQFDIYDDKSGPALCFEVPDETRKGSEKEFIFIGYAPE